MNTERADIIAVGALGPQDGAFVDVLLQVAKAPLGWHGEFCARYFLHRADQTQLPMGVVMCLEPVEVLERWTEQCRAGTLVLLAPSAPRACADEALTRGAIVCLSVDHPLRAVLPPSAAVVVFENAGQLISQITQTVKSRAANLSRG